MDDKKFFTDIFSVGYNENKGSPLLIVGRNTNRGIDVIKVFKDKEAEDIYRQLITPSNLESHKEESDE